MRGRSRAYNVADERVVALRKAGHSCRTIATDLGIPESHVWNVMKRTGNAGRYHATPARDKKPKADTAGRITDVLDEFGVLTVEEGVNGGYIVTLDDEWTGTEHQSVRAAIDAAVKEASND